MDLPASHILLGGRRREAPSTVKIRLRQSFSGQQISRSISRDADSKGGVGEKTWWLGHSACSDLFWVVRCCRGDADTAAIIWDLTLILSCEPL
jgi:hypothetical protein